MRNVHKRAVDLDYAAAETTLTRARLQRWTLRILVPLLIAASLYAAPIVWFYWGWKREQAARATILRLGGPDVKVKEATVGLGFLRRLVPARWGWITRRVNYVVLSSSAKGEDATQVCRAVGQLTYLTTLGLNQIELADKDLVYLGGLSKLESLSLGQTPITDSGLYHLRNLISLEGLNLNGTQVTDAGLNHLRDMKQLKYLRLAGTKIEGQGLGELRCTETLQYLDLYWTPFDDGGASRLGRFKGLRNLYLSRTRITDAGLIHLQALTGLRTVDVDLSEVTEEGFIRLQQALPKGTVVTEQFRKKTVTQDGSEE